MAQPTLPILWAPFLSALSSLSFLTAPLGLDLWRVLGPVREDGRRLVKLLWKVTVLWVISSSLFLTLGLLHPEEQWFLNSDLLNSLPKRHCDALDLQKFPGSQSLVGLHVDA